MCIWYSQWKNYLAFSFETELLINKCKLMEKKGARFKTLSK